MKSWKISALILRPLFRYFSYVGSVQTISGPLSSPGVQNKYEAWMVWYLTLEKQITLIATHLSDTFL
jgi:hypothetical protein